MKYKTAIVGARDAVAVFTLLGVDIVPVESEVQAVEELLRLKKETQTDENGREHNAYAIIFITEDLAGGISPDDEKKLAKGALPAIIPLPSHQGSTGYGMQRLRRIVERAVGSDILQ
ncbi:V-type ATP synthase subunit F [Candidatus Peregrinibacteria bacterium]|jgi:V/A-type H+/Na+-transporting ATPase subunit F|nr:V-type ATP synthase subunit F [Candidatus Peregrinibacteria bacterium]MBT5468316.1 V-type ATP synthase subunit F [Candidatus Peregrinibacteria bacterium]MBT6823660.1 V-type ATP synthase subunit F [Candidatus Peribacter sp.]MBT7338030.1 V-type ATP synthase subunit F [Candidatus Peregrinibacteria bacterium]MBT7494764.1 V-type ATP synthase subunit F [Candidatus Peribacter sp.]